MNFYYELPELNKDFPFKIFKDQGFAEVEPHFHQELEMIMIEEGEVTVGNSIDRYHLQKGDIFFFAPRELHYFFPSFQSSRLVLQINLHKINEFMNMFVTDNVIENLKRAEPWSRNWHEELSMRVGQCITTIYNLSQNKSSLTILKIASITFDLLATFMESINLSATPRPKIYKTNDRQFKKLEDVFNYVHDNYHESITLDKVADQVGYTPQYLSKLFKETVGINFSDFLIMYRIEKAKYYLQENKCSMSEVVVLSGFQSQQTFFRVFKREVHITPLQYQKQYNLKI